MAITTTVANTRYQLVSAGGDDDNFVIDVSINRTNQALSGVTEIQMLTFIRNYLATLTPNPIQVVKIEEVHTTGF